MIDWIYNLSLVWLVVVVFAETIVAAGLVCLCVSALSGGLRAQTLGAVSPGLLPPLGIVFALVVGFLAAGVWSDASDARLAVNREAPCGRRTCWSTSSRAQTRRRCGRSSAAISPTPSIGSGLRWSNAGCG